MGGHDQWSQQGRGRGSHFRTEVSWDSVLRIYIGLWVCNARRFDADGLPRFLFEVLSGFPEIRAGRGEVFLQVLRAWGVCFQAQNRKSSLRCSRLGAKTENLWFCFPVPLAYGYYIFLP